MNELNAIIATVMRASSHRFVGRLARDPEVKYLDSGKAVANGRIAINVPGSKQGDGKEPDWFKVVTNQTATNIENKDAPTKIDSAITKEPGNAYVNIVEKTLS